VNPLVRRLQKLERARASQSPPADDIGWAQTVLAERAGIAVDGILRRYLTPCEGWAAEHSAPAMPAGDVERARAIVARLNPGREQSAAQRANDVAEIIERRLALCRAEAEPKSEEIEMPPESMRR
jgi:hypothetical protein